MSDLQQSRRGRLLADRVKAGDIVIDAGAAGGGSTQLLASLVGPTGRVIAIEPDPRNLASLERRCEENGLSNVAIMPKALGASIGSGTLYQDTRAFRSSLAAANVVSPAAETEVEVTTLDAVIAELGIAPSVVNLSVNGAEAQALAGAEETLKRRPILFAWDYWPDGLKAFGGEPFDLIEWLYARGLKVGVFSDSRGLVATEMGRIALKVYNREKTPLATWRDATRK